MKRSAALTLAALAVGIGIPALILQQRPQPSPDRQSAQPSGTEGTRIVDETAEGCLDSSLTLQVLMSNGSVKALPLNTYLSGVLLAEMPTSFHPEALKAQAVVSRTYTLRRISGGKHEEADICTNSACCQGWTDLDAYCLENNLTSSDEKIQAVFQAVRDTDGEVLTYDGGLIDATYFSSAGGQTEAAVEVWGSDVPYLQPVDSPEAEAPYNDEQVTFSPEEFAGLIYTIAPQANLSGSPDTWFGAVTETVGGGVETIAVGGVSLTGKELRSLLGLRSTIFTVAVEGGQIVFRTRGFGHRVGMSQYGAEAMAVQGSSYTDILTHYYRGVRLENYFH